MTTWQDQQPKSRRALRESERAHTQGTASHAVGEQLTGSGLDQQPWQEQPVPSTFGVAPGVTPEPHHAGPGHAAAQPVAEPLRRPRQSRREVDSSSTESPAYRIRDFSPETRGSTFSSTQSAPWTPPEPGSEDLRYQTSVDANRPAQSVVSDFVITEEPIEHTLTRREVRELRNAAMGEGTGEVVLEAHEPELVERQAAAPQVSPPVDLVSPPAETPTASSTEGELATAMAEFDKLFHTDRQAPPPVEPTVNNPAGAATPAEPAGFDWSAPDPAPINEAPPASEASRRSRRASHAPEVELVTESVIPPAVEQAEPLREMVTAPEVYSAPVGHWSREQVMDEDPDTAARPHQRDIASSDAITTSALVLPNFPPSMPTTGPVSGTGEILMTGSITLPRSLGVNGLHPSRYDRPDIDDIIDAADRSDVAPDSAPVRAVRAVSTYTSSQSVINAKRPKGSNLPMVLSITAGVMMVGVVVLVVVGMIFKIF